MPHAEPRCPHCGRAAERAGGSSGLGKKVAAVAATAVASAGFAVTLMACYGPPPREYEKVDAPPPPSAAGQDGGAGTDMPKAK